MVPNARFWAQYFREFHVRTIEGFRAGALEKVAAAFSSVAEEADAAADWAVHAWFGPVSGREWGMLCWEHTDYHLRQFGV